MGAVFISYRRGDAEGQARALFNDLSEIVGKDSVFMDVDSMTLGRDFRVVLQDRLASSELMLALIGPGWVEAKDKSGNRRLDNPDDYVRTEIATALKRNIPVTPILVQGAQMPDPALLPDDLKNLAYRNGFELSHTRWDSDVREMARRLGLGQSVTSPPAEMRPQPAAAQPRWRLWAIGILGVLGIALVLWSGVFQSKPPQSSPSGEPNASQAPIGSPTIETPHTPPRSAGVGETDKTSHSATIGSAAVVGAANWVYFFDVTGGGIIFNRALLGKGGEGWVALPKERLTDAPPAAAAVGTHLFVAMKGTDNVLYLNQADVGGSFGEWQPLSFRTDVSPALAAVGNSIYVFAKGLDNRIQVNQAVLGRSFSGWAEVEGNGRTDVAPATAAVGDHVFVGIKGMDGNVSLNQADLGHAFSGWNTMGLKTAVAPAVAAAGSSVLVFVTGLDQRIQVNQAVLGQAFSGWREVDGGGRTNLSPGAGAVGTHIFVTIRGLDGNRLLNQGDMGHPFGQWFLFN